MAISQRRMTLEEFLELPEEKPALEFEAGWVRQKDMPKGPHAKLQSTLARLLDSFGVPLRLASAFTEARVTFGGRSVVPDLVVYRWMRVPVDAGGRIAEDFTTPPDIAIEIISPGQTLTSVEERCQWYLEYGVEIALLVHPRRESVTLFRAGETPLTLVGDDPIDLSSVLPGFQLSAGELFASLRLR